MLNFVYTMTKEEKATYFTSGSGRGAGDRGGTGLGDRSGSGRQGQGRSGTGNRAGNNK